MEDHLYSQLKKFNDTVYDKYRDNWGSAISFLDPSVKIRGNDYDEVAIAN